MQQTGNNLTILIIKGTVMNSWKISVNLKMFKLSELKIR